jgi:hypothetical protein
VKLFWELPVVPQPLSGQGSLLNLEVDGEVVKSRSIIKQTHAYALSAVLGHMAIYGMTPLYGKDVF